MSGSPIPGKAPYFEGEAWQEFHGRLAGEINRQFMPLIKPKYVALLAERLVLESPILEEGQVVHSE